MAEVHSPSTVRGALLSQRRERSDPGIATARTPEGLGGLRDVAERTAATVVLVDEFASQVAIDDGGGIRCRHPPVVQAVRAGRSSSRRSGRRRGASSPTSPRGMRRRAPWRPVDRERRSTGRAAHGCTPARRVGRRLCRRIRRAGCREARPDRRRLPSAPTRGRDGRRPPPTAIAAGNGARPRDGRTAGSRRCACRRPRRAAPAPARSPDRGVTGRRRAHPMRRRSRRAASERRIRRCRRGDRRARASGRCTAPMRRSVRTSRGAPSHSWTTDHRGTSTPSRSSLRDTTSDESGSSPGSAPASWSCSRRA